MVRLPFVFLLILLFVTILRVGWYFEKLIPYEDGQDLVLKTTLFKEPKTSARSQRLSIKDSEGRRISIATTSFPQYSYGDSLSVEGKLKVETSDKGSVFYNLSFPKITKLPNANPVLLVSSAVRQRVSDLYYRSLPPESAGLMLGIVFGITDQLDDDLLTNLQTTGVMHITAASGMNITLLAGAVLFFLASIFSRKIAIVSSMAIIWLYAVVAGLDASIVRAAIMATVTFSAAIFGRQSNAYFALFLTIIGMLLWSPGWVTDIGFQLSVSATLGILIFSPLFGMRPSVVPETEMVKSDSPVFLQDIFMTISAQLSTLPILLFHFGQFGFIGFLANMLVLWSVPILLVLGLIGALASVVNSSLAGVVVVLNLPLLYYMQSVISLLAKFPISFSLDTVPLSLIVGYYFLLASIILGFYKRKYR